MVLAEGAVATGRGVSTGSCFSCVAACASRLRFCAANGTLPPLREGRNTHSTPSRLHLVQGGEFGRSTCPKSHCRKTSQRQINKERERKGYKPAPSLIYNAHKPGVTSVEGLAMSLRCMGAASAKRTLNARLDLVGLLLAPGGEAVAEGGRSDVLATGSAEAGGGGPPSCGSTTAGPALVTVCGDTL